LLLILTAQTTLELEFYDRLGRWLVDDQSSGTAAVLRFCWKTRGL